ncbi:MAG: hypothetical protein IID53_12430 [Proteobacteria bacterium]|nr:hypothetical protein [Pseudomonadota bacterium]
MTVTRREAMKHGGKAVVAAAVLPIVAKSALASEGEDSELIALWLRHQERWERASQLQKEEDRLIESGPKAELFKAGALVWGEVNEIEHQIAAIPANTFAGLAIKLRIGTDNQTFKTDLCFKVEELCMDELNLMTALADAERLAGGAI